jgi:catechol 2,3-dioxygenase-like lactoylglutathione lyase family enzyme
LLAGVFASSDDLAPFSVVALRLGVTDLDESVEFYVDHLGFRATERGDGWAALENDGVPLVLTVASAAVTIGEGQSHVRFNFAVADLDAKVTAMKDAGVTFVSEGKSAVGRYATFLDPSGHRHNVKQLFQDEHPSGTPRVYDVGIAVTDIDRAVAYYEKRLGFGVRTRSYYPPVIPFDQHGATFFIAADGAKSAAPYSEIGAFAGLAFEARDAAAALALLWGDAPRSTPMRLGAWNVLATFTDPFGNRHELVARALPSRAETLAAFERFKQLAGTWEGKSTKGWTEKIDYQVIARGSVVMEQSRDAHPNEIMTSMVHRDGDRLLLTHYCVAGSQPRLVLSAVEDAGRTLRFSFLDATNLASRDRGHMDSVVFRFADADHFTAQWSWYQDGKESWMEDIEHRRENR